MNKLRKYFYGGILFLVFSCSSSCFAQWQLYYDFGTNVNDVNFISPDTVFYNKDYWISPSSGTGWDVFRTCNAGSTWNSVTGASGLGISSHVFFTIRKQKIIYATSNNQGMTQVIRSDNRGTTWHSNGDLGPWGYGLFAVDTGCYYGFNSCTAGGCYNLTSYRNGTAILKSVFSTFVPATLFFPVQDTGFMIGYTYNPKKTMLYKTSDSGSTWPIIFSDTTINLNCLYFTSGAIGYFAGDSGRIIKTINGGNSWTYLNTNCTNNLNSIFFINDTIGYAAGNSGTIIKTFDGGSNWQKDTSGTTENFRKIYFVSDSFGFALTNYRKLFSLDLRANGVGINPLKQEAKNNNPLLISPNPNEGKCDIKIPDDFLNEKNLTLSIFSNEGKLIQQKILEMNDGKINVNIEQEAKGIYNVTLSGKGKTYNGKIVFE